MTTQVYGKPFFQGNPVGMAWGIGRENSPCAQHFDSPRMTLVVLIFADFLISSATIHLILVICGRPHPLHLGVLAALRETMPV